MSLTRGPSVGLKRDHELRGVGQWLPQIVSSKAHLTIAEGSPATPLATHTVSIQALAMTSVLNSKIRLKTVLFEPGDNIQF